MLSVQHAVGEPKVSFCTFDESGVLPSSDGHPNRLSCKPAEEEGEGFAVVLGEHAGDVLPNHPTGACAGSHPVSQCCKLEGELTTSSIQPCSESGDGEVLAGRSSDKNVNWSILASLDQREVAGIRNHAFGVEFVHGSNGRQHGAAVVLGCMVVGKRHAFRARSVLAMLEYGARKWRDFSQNRRPPA